MKTVVEVPVLAEYAVVLLDHLEEEVHRHRGQVAETVRLPHAVRQLPELVVVDGGRVFTVGLVGGFEVKVELDVVVELVWEDRIDTDAGVDALVKGSRHQGGSHEVGVERMRMLLEGQISAVNVLERVDVLVTEDVGDALLERAGSVQLPLQFGVEQGAHVCSVLVPVREPWREMRRDDGRSPGL